jgi:hypothetical protein
MTVHGMHREASIEIHASPEAVYDLVSDLPRMGEWSPENIGSQWQDGGRGQVGDRYIGHNRAGERAWSVPVMVTVAERGRCFEFVTRPDDGPYVRWTYRLEPSGAGTRVTKCGMWNNSRPRCRVPPRNNWTNALAPPQRLWPPLSPPSKRRPRAERQRTRPAQVVGPPNSKALIRRRESRWGRNRAIGLGAISLTMTPTEMPVVWPRPLGVGRPPAEACCYQCHVLSAVRTAVVSS